MVSYRVQIVLWGAVISRVFCDSYRVCVCFILDLLGYCQCLRFSSNNEEHDIKPTDLVSPMLKFGERVISSQELLEEAKSKLLGGGIAQR